MALKIGNFWRFCAGFKIHFHIFVFITTHKKLLTKSKLTRTILSLLYHLSCNFRFGYAAVYLDRKIDLFVVLCCGLAFRPGSKLAAYNLEMFVRWLISVIVIGGGGGKVSWRNVDLQLFQPAVYILHQKRCVNSISLSLCPNQTLRQNLLLLG